MALFGSNKLASIDPVTYQLTEHELPRPNARPRRLAITSSDRIWYVDYSNGVLGRYDPVEGVFTEQQLPGGRDARPYGMAADSSDRLWLVETGEMPNRLVGYDPEQREFISVQAIGSGAGTVRHMHYDPATGNLWFGTDTNYLGRASLH